MKQISDQELVPSPPSERRPRSSKILAGAATLFMFLTLAVARPACAIDTFADDLGKLNGLAKQIEGDEKEIEELIERKKTAEDKLQQEEVVTELVKKHRDLEKISQEYEQLRLHIRFKHPEKNETVEHKYVHYKLKTLTEMEGGFGLDGRLDRTKAHVMAIFPAAPEEKPATAQSIFAKTRGPASVIGETDDQEDMPGRILLRK